ncbi:HAD-IA family hydrolase [Clostridium felsineum]|uniref:Pyrophosphatase PpaX n=1 Tax=Clostridium felsineum TaxID=36839 RepID=A0A1S8LQC9_9CLOT|nr:HAD-IA family hydrolase [Clostridium felsineum]URZ07754.1 Pyrophosphatase PpaX [Clostridium felsineum]URZ12785.1 Pyrophosphatase PpaX [Clostridium felsineum]
MIKDIIWDFDGTLFDTYPETVKAFKKSLSDNGIVEDMKNILNYLKVSDGFAIEHFKQLYELDDSFIIKYNFYKNNIKPEMVKPFPFTIEILKELTKMGCRNYIITHRGDSTLKFLKHYNLLECFTEIITKKYGFKRKPDPEAFIYLIEKYKMNKSKTLIIGDRDYEILAGKACGIRTCLYDTNNISSKEKPDFYITSLKNLMDIAKFQK